MKRYIYLLIILFGFYQGNTQDTLSTQDQKLMQKLNMKTEDYKGFAKAMKEYDQRMLTIHHNQNLSFLEKETAIEKLRTDRQTFIAAHLSLEQQGLLKAYYQKTGSEHHSSPAEKKREQVEKLKQSSVKRNGSSS